MARRQPLDERPRQRHRLGVLLAPDQQLPLCELHGVLVVARRPERAHPALERLDAAAREEEVLLGGEHVEHRRAVALALGELERLVEVACGARP